MRRSQLKWTFGALLCWFSSTIQANNVEFVIIAHPTIEESNIDLTSLRQVFTARKKSWQNGSDVKVVMRETQSPAQLEFCNQMLRMFPYQVQRIWHQVTFSGQGEAAISAYSNEDMIDKVSSTPGAIGYVSSDTSLDERVNVILITGGS